MNNRHIALSAGALALIGLAAGLTLPPSTLTNTAPPAGSIPAEVECQEDDPCWDCTTMGNHICGGTELTDADRAKAWETWDRTGPASLPTAYTTKETRVTFVGVAPSLPPKVDRQHEVALVGTDSKWYVFSSDPVLSE